MIIVPLAYVVCHLKKFRQPSNTSDKRWRTWDTSLCFCPSIPGEQIMLRICIFLFTIICCLFLLNSLSRVSPYCRHFLWIHSTSHSTYVRTQTAVQSWQIFRIIQYVWREISSTSCILKMTGFTNRGHVRVPGIDLMTESRKCTETNHQLTAQSRQLLE